MYNCPTFYRMNAKTTYSTIKTKPPEHLLKKEKTHFCSITTKPTTSTAEHQPTVNNITVVSACPDTSKCEDSSLVQNTSHRSTPSTNSDTRLLANR